MKDQDYIRQINQALSSYLNKHYQNAPTAEAKVLIQRIKKTTKGGKRLRPLLMLFIYKAYGGKQDIIDIGLALELLHQSLLIHDDLIDDDLIRHGQPNIAGQYLKETHSKKLAYDQALLAGDLVYNFSLQLISSRNEILELFNQAFISAIYGQQLDLLNIDNKLAGISLNKLIDIYLLKTASYSSILPIKTASFLAKVNKNEEQKLTEFAKSLGIYIQLANDHQDYFKDGQLKDYCLGKISYPYILGLKLIKGADKKYFTLHFASKQVETAKVREILKKSSIEEQSLTTLNKYLNKTLIALNKLEIADKYRTSLIDLVGSIGV